MGIGRSNEAHAERRLIGCKRKSSAHQRARIGRTHVLPLLLGKRIRICRARLASEKEFEVTIFREIFCTWGQALTCPFLLRNLNETFVLRTLLQ